MFNLTKKEKLNFIKEIAEKNKVSAYEIAKHTNLTEAGVGKILNGTVKNPHESSIDSILIYFDKEQKNNKFTILNEPETPYNKSNNDTEGYRDCLLELNKMTLEIVKLQNLLRKNNIPFKNIFSEDDEE